MCDEVGREADALAFFEEMGYESIDELKLGKLHL